MHHCVRPFTLVLLALLLSFTTTTTSNARQTTPAYGVLEITALDGTLTYARAIDQQGYFVAGSAHTASGEHAFAGNPYFTFTDLGTLGGPRSVATDVNELGWVVGHSDVPGGTHAFVYRDGSMTDLGLGTSHNWAWATNDNGAIVGDTAASGAERRAYIHRNGSVTLLNLGTVFESHAYGINNLDHVVGALKLTQSSPSRGYIWESGVATSVGALGPGGMSIATAINDSDIVVGQSTASAANTEYRAFRWQNGVMQALPSLGGAQSLANSINSGGLIVGWSQTAQGATHAVLWRDGQIFDLNTLIKPNSGWELQNAIQVNDRGQIVGYGRRDGVTRGFVLVPAFDIRLSLDYNPQEIDVNRPNPHEAGTLVTLGAAAYGTGEYPVTNLVIRSTLTGPVEYVDWFDADCEKDGQTLTCKLRTFEANGAGVIMRVRSTGTGPFTHSATIVSSDQADSTPNNNSASQTNTAVSLASMTLAKTSTIGGENVLSRVTLTSRTPAGGAPITLTSSHPGIAKVPQPFDVVDWSGDGLWREFYVDTEPVSAPTTVTISATYGLVTKSVELTLMPAGASFPYGGSPHPVPGTIQAENYDGGGQNVGYYDSTAGNDGDAYRDDDVDIERTTDAGGGHNVGWMARGEWLQYTVNVASAGTYRLDLRVAANAAGGNVHVEFAGVNKTGTMTIPNTGGWQSWTTISAPVTLSAGMQPMRVVVDSAGPTGVVGNLNSLHLTAISTGGGSRPYTGTPVALPGTVQAENFDHGGADVAYRDTSAGNSGGAYRNDVDVDIQGTTDAGGGHNVGWMAPTEWLNYTVNVQTAGNYRLDLRVAANGSGGRVHVEFDGVNKTGPMTIPNTGGWQSWTTISAPVNLSAGTQRMRVVVDAAGSTGVVGNLNYIQVAGAGTPTAPGDIVIYASDVPDAALHGDWSKGVDATSPGNVSLQTVERAYATANSPLASPAHYVDVAFTPVANTPYTLWLRLKALNDSKYNDAVWVQFSSAQANGQVVYPIGSTSGLLVNLATDASAASLQNWGWANGAYWLTQPATLTFPAGSQTLRIQVREDGVRVDQIVLSPKTYLSSPPGGPTNDTTIVPK